MSLDIYIDVSYHLTSQARALDLKGLELNAEIETGCGGHSRAHRPGVSGSIPQEWHRCDGSFRSDGGRGPYSWRLLSALRFQGPTCRGSVRRRGKGFG